MNTSLLKESQITIELSMLFASFEFGQIVEQLVRLLGQIKFFKCRLRSSSWQQVAT